jgi:hypothetical protein
MGASQSLHIALHVPTKAHASATATPQNATWGIFVGPKSKSATGTLHYASQGYRETAHIAPSAPDPEPHILVLVAVAKVVRPKGPRGLPNVLESVPAERGWAGAGGKMWVKEALQALNSMGCLGGRKVTEWPVVEQECLRFLGKKVGVGRWREGEEGKGKWKGDETPMWDLIQGREIVG